MLEEHGMHKRFGAGETIFTKGDPGDFMYVVESGKVEIVGLSDGHEVKLSTLGADEIFGEMALFGGAPRSATARAVEDTELRAIGQDDVDALVPDPLAWKLLSVLSQRLRDVDGKLSYLTAQSDLRRDQVMDLYDFRSRYG